MIGQTIGNYRIVDKLGDGGMGTVYRAVDGMLDREVAIKVLRADRTRKDGLVERFKQEAKALARLNHPRIATLHGLEWHNDELLMIMEYVRGETLETIVERSGRIMWPRACELCVAVLDALDHAHDMGIVHRDIKPANIMLAHNGAVKVMDFGIARMLGKSRQTQVGQAVGTPMYMAPEQLRGQEVDARTDIYAVGAVLFELITGRIAFDAESDYELMMKKLNDPPPPPSQYVPDVPPIVDAIVFRAMANNPTDRFPNASAFIDELTKAIGLANLPSASKQPGRSTPVPETRIDTSYSSYPNIQETLPEAGRVVERRLASDVPPVETRLASVGFEPRNEALSSITRNGQATITNRLSDWRLYAAAGAVFTVLGLGIKLIRPANTDTSTEKQEAETVAENITQGSITPQVQQVEDPASLRIPPSGTGTVAPVPPISSVPPVSPPPVRERDRISKGGAEQQPPANRVEGSSDNKAETSDRNRESETTTGASSVTGGVAAPASAVNEYAESTRHAIQAALAAAVADLSSPNTVSDILHGEAKNDWVALAREGRISVGAPSNVDFKIQGTIASATFSGDVNVRSPFGANRRSATQFSADLEREGSRWRVVSVRPIGKVKLR